MSTTELLEQAIEHMRAAQQLVQQARQQNQSLEGYYGYSLQIVCQELCRFSDNSAGYLGHNTNLQEIIDNASVHWQNDDPGHHTQLHRRHQSPHGGTARPPNEAGRSL